MFVVGFFCLICISVWQILIECSFFNCSWSFSESFSPSCGSFSMRTLYFSNWALLLLLMLLLMLMMMMMIGLMCYISVGVIFYIAFNSFQKWFQKCYTPSILYIHDIFSSFLWIASFWKCRMILLVVWAFGFIGTIFLHLVWVFLATLQYVWYPLQLSLWCLYFLHLKCLKSSEIYCSTFLRYYPIFTFFSIEGLLNINCMCVFVFLHYPF